MNVSRLARSVTLNILNIMSDFTRRNSGTNERENKLSAHSSRKNDEERLKVNTHEFSAMLTPNRSLSPKGFIIFMICISIVCFTTGLVFTLAGAWPVMGFMGLDVLLIYLAFRKNYNDLKIFETISLTSNELILERVYPSGRSQSFQYNPFWVKVGIKEHSSGATKMQLISHGKVLNFGNFLSDDERREFASVLNREINLAKKSLNANI